MYIKVTIENKFMTLCNIDAECNKKGKKEIQESWSKVEQFLKNSHYDGKANLVISLNLDDVEVFNKVKMRMKKDSYTDVFDLLECFLYDKLYFFNKLEEKERKKSYIFQNEINKKALTNIQKMKKVYLNV